MALSRINLTSRPRPQLDSSLAIVNVILMLIFFFLASGRFMSQFDLEVDPPLTRNLPADAMPTSLLVILPDEDIRLDGERIAIEELENAVAGLSQINILIDRTAPAGRLAGVLTRLDTAAIDLRIVTQDGVDANPP